MSEGQKDFVVLGDSVATFESPTNAVRWVVRGSERVLQQAWVATGQDRHGYITYRHEQWRDVPTVVEQPSTTQE